MAFWHISGGLGNMQQSLKGVIFQIFLTAPPKLLLFPLLNKEIKND